jgi:hypothetical protein
LLATSTPLRVLAASHGVVVVVSAVAKQSAVSQQVADALGHRGANPVDVGGRQRWQEGVELWRSVANAY